MRSAGHWTTSWTRPANNSPQASQRAMATWRSTCPALPTPGSDLSPQPKCHAITSSVAIQARFMAAGANAGAPNGPRT